MQDGHTRPERLELHVLKAVYIFRPRRIVQCTMCGVIILNGSLCDLTTLRGFEIYLNLYFEVYLKCYRKRESRIIITYTLHSVEFYTFTQQAKGPCFNPSDVVSRRA